MDRFARGFTAGVLAWIVQAIVGFILFSLNLTELLWLHFAAVMIYGREPLFLGEQIFAEMAVSFFSGLMGVVFAYQIPKIGSRHHLFKGFLFGEAIWFASFAITLLFKVPEFEIIAFRTALANFAQAAVWGLINAELLHRLDNRTVD